MTNEDNMRWLVRIADVLRENRTYLTELEYAFCYADHGINIDRGFSSVRSKFPTMESMDIASQLKTVGSTLVSTVGGASGPLYGTAFLRAGGAVANKQELTPAHVVAMLDAFTGGIVARGTAQPGEKTMVDALTPAVPAAKRALNERASLSDITHPANV